MGNRISRNPWPLVLLLASLVHLSIGLSISYDEVNVQQVLFISGLDIFQTEFSIPIDTVGAVLVITAILSLLGLFNERRFSRWIIVSLMMPQFLILMMTFYLHLFIILNGEFRDMDVSRWMALAGLAWPTFASGLHTVGLYDRYIRCWER